MQGSKYNSEVREKAKVLLATYNKVDDAAKAVNIGVSTLYDWKREWENDGSLEELRKRKKEEWEDLYIKQAQEIIELANERVKNTIKEASPAQAATIAGIYTDKMRLIQGETTSNVGQQGLTIMIGNQVVNGNNNTEKTINNE